MHDENSSSAVRERPSVTGGTSSQVPRQQRWSSLDDYEIIREIGRGGTAVVYEAFHKSLRRRVALKQIPAAAALDPRWQERFQNEVHATSQLSHSNIVPFYELGNGGDSQFYTMQLIDGISLAEVICCLRQCREGNRPCLNPQAECVHPAFFRLCERCKCQFACRDAVIESDGKPTDLISDPEYHRAVVELMRDAAMAVQYAHDQGILHLDIKPSNILIDGEGKLWITDFGASRSNGGAGSEGLSGTLCYMSPEQLERDDELDARSDVYSLGATLYELLTLVRPFADVSPHVLVTHVSLGQLMSPRQANTAISSELNTITSKATARDPDDRYATACELADDLQGVIRSPAERSLNTDAKSKVTLWRRLWLLIAVRGKAFQFDGVDDWISTNHSFSNDQSHSISAWVKWQGRRSNGFQEVVSWWNRDDVIPNRIFLGTISPTKTRARIRFGDDWTNVPGRILPRFGDRSGASPAAVPTAAAVGSTLLRLKFRKIHRTCPFVEVSPCLNSERTPPPGARTWRPGNAATLLNTLFPDDE